MLDGKAEVSTQEDGSLRITGPSTAEVGHLAFVERIELHELTTEHSDLEDIFFSLTGNGGEVGHFGAVEGGTE